ncbi:Rrf2 family transcriptional regulator [bacterium]|nr:Rrf2 family transcriptional regulator [bacterium]
MKLFTKQSDYAVRAIIGLARARGAYRSSREIAREERIPLPFLRRILQTLAQHGVVEAREGASGGVRLARPARAIRLSEIVTYFQGPVQLSECLFQKRLCHNRASCVLRHRIMAIEALIVREFDKITIAALLRNGKHHA